MIKDMRKILVHARKNCVLLLDFILINSKIDFSIVVFQVSRNFVCGDSRVSLKAKLTIRMYFAPAVPFYAKPRDNHDSNNR